MKSPKLAWQSKFVLLLVLPAVGAQLVLEGAWWVTQFPDVAEWTVGLSLLLGLAAWQSRSATAGAAVTGAAICATLMFATTSVPYAPWRTALVPVLTLLILTSMATRVGRLKKQNLGTAESKAGRDVAQVAANLGIAALISSGMMQTWILNQTWLPGLMQSSSLLIAPALAAMAEAAADTVSSELGQVFNSHPRMITTLQRVPPGTDGAISIAGTSAGALAAGVVVVVAAASLQTGWLVPALAWTGGMTGLFFDSLLGATLERRSWLNNDGVNFLSTASASGITLGLMAALLPHLGR
ncbi:MAG: DUF92 domain-containing protein [Terracidiphilus sp.]